MQYRTGCAQKQNQNYEQKILSILRHFYCNRCFLWPFHSYVNQVTPMKIKNSQQGSRNKIHDTLRKPLRQICWFFLTTCTYHKGFLPTAKPRHNAKLVLFEIHHAQRERHTHTNSQKVIYTKSILPDMKFFSSKNFVMQGPAV